MLLIRRAYHECLKVWSPPLSQAVSDLPFIVHTMRSVELSGIGWWRKAVVQTLLETFNLVFARFQVISRT